MAAPSPLIVVTAPSGAGKSTLIKRLMEKHPEFCFSVSHTTRLAREGEEHEKDYFFTNIADFHEMIDEDAFLEWAEVHGNFYGTSKNEIDKLSASGRRVILDLDVQGGLALMSKDINALFVFISVPSIEILEKRLFSRGTDDEESIKRRLDNAVKEFAMQDHWQHVIINDRLDEAFEEFEKLILSH